MRGVLFKALPLQEWQQKLTFCVDAIFNEVEDVQGKEIHRMGWFWVRGVNFFF
jgi:hypothetical protein